MTTLGRLGLNVDQGPICSRCGIALGWIRIVPSRRIRGIYGMDFYVHLSRPGLRVQYRKLRRGKVGSAHRLRKEDGMKWFQTKYDGIILN